MVHSSNPVRSARRKAELRERLCAEQPVCFYCGYEEPVALRRISRKFLEKHHLLGRNHDPGLTILVCRNCHALLHEKLINAKVDLQAEPNLAKRVPRMLRAEAVHHELLASTKRQQAAWLEGEKR